MGGLPAEQPQIGSLELDWRRLRARPRVDRRRYLSTCSEKSLPSAATVCKASANAPAKGPIPTQTTNTITMMSGSIERIPFKIVRVTKYTPVAD